MAAPGIPPGLPNPSPDSSGILHRVDNKDDFEMTQQADGKSYLITTTQGHKWVLNEIDTKVLDTEEKIRAYVAANLKVYDLATLEQQTLLAKGIRSEVTFTPVTTPPSGTSAPYEITAIKVKDFANRVIFNFDKANRDTAQEADKKKFEQISIAANRYFQFNRNLAENRTGADQVNQPVRKPLSNEAIVKIKTSFSSDLNEANTTDNHEIRVKCLIKLTKYIKQLEGSSQDVGDLKQQLNKLIREKFAYDSERFSQLISGNFTKYPFSNPPRPMYAETLEKNLINYMAHTLLSDKDERADTATIQRMLENLTGGGRFTEYWFQRLKDSEALRDLIYSTGLQTSIKPFSDFVRQAPPRPPRLSPAAYAQVAAAASASQPVATRAQLNQNQAIIRLGELRDKLNDFQAYPDVGGQFSKMNDALASFRQRGAFQLPERETTNLMNWVAWGEKMLAKYGQMQGKHQQQPAHESTTQQTQTTDTSGTSTSTSPPTEQAFYNATMEAVRLNAELMRKMGSHLNDPQNAKLKSSSDTIAQISAEAVGSHNIRTIEEHSNILQEGLNRELRKDLRSKIEATVLKLKGLQNLNLIPTPTITDPRNQHNIFTLGDAIKYLETDLAPNSESWGETDIKNVMRIVDQINVSSDENLTQSQQGQVATPTAVPQPPSAAQAQPAAQTAAVQDYTILRDASSKQAINFIGLLQMFKTTYPNLEPNAREEAIQKVKGYINELNSDPPPEKLKEINENLRLLSFTWEINKKRADLTTEAPSTATEPEAAAEPAAVLSPQIDTFAPRPPEALVKHPSIMETALRKETEAVVKHTSFVTEHAELHEMPVAEAEGTEAQATTEPEASLTSPGEAESSAAGTEEAATESEEVAAEPETVDESVNMSQKMRINVLSDRLAELHSQGVDTDKVEKALEDLTEDQGSDSPSDISSDLAEINDFIDDEQLGLDRALLQNSEKMSQELKKYSALLTPSLREYLDRTQTHFEALHTQDSYSDDDRRFLKEHIEYVRDFLPNDATTSLESPKETPPAPPPSPEPSSAATPRATRTEPAPAAATSPPILKEINVVRTKAQSLEKLFKQLDRDKLTGPERRDLFNDQLIPNVPIRPSRDELDTQMKLLDSRIEKWTSILKRQQAG